MRRIQTEAGTYPREGGEAEGKCWREHSRIIHVDQQQWSAQCSKSSEQQCKVVLEHKHKGIINVQ
jgi:hypothetical protein